MSKALVIVDVQEDFVEGGSLAVEGGRAVASRLAEWLPKEGFAAYDFIVTTQDWHIDPGSHFSDEPDFVDSWPVHCVAGEKGSTIVPELARVLEGKVDLEVHKGEYEAAYSGFEGKVVKTGQSLAEALRESGVDEVDVCGLATDYCVGQTALSSVEEGFTTKVLTDFVAGINEDKIAETLNSTFPRAGVGVVASGR